MENLKKDSQEDRVYVLDSLRGIAALVVALGHFFPEEIKKILFFNLFVDTKLAVAIFFVLSGLVLFKSSVVKNFKSFFINASARYLRLSIPVFFCSLGIMVLSKIFDTDYYLKKPFDHWNIVNSYKQDPINFYRVVKFSFFETMIKYDSKTSIIPPAWTLRPEFAGSVFIFLMLYFFRKKEISKSYKNILLGICCFLIFTYNHVPLIYYFSFFASGALIYLLRPINLKRQNYILFLVLLFRSIQKYYDSWSLLSDFIIGSLIVFCVYKNKTIERPLSNKKIVFLGKISFSIYLLHFGVFTYITPALVNCLSHQIIINPKIQFVIVTVFTFLILFLLSNIFHSFDKMAICINRKIKKIS